MNSSCKGKKTRKAFQTQQRQKPSRYLKASFTASSVYQHFKILALTWVGLWLFPQSLKRIGSTMVIFGSHWRGLLHKVTQGYLWSSLLSLPPLWLCSHLLPLIPQHRFSLVPLQSKVRAQECWWLKNPSRTVGDCREGGPWHTAHPMCSVLSVQSTKKSHSVGQVGSLIDKIFPIPTQ